MFRVRDSGMGIPAAALSSIFDLFAQAERTLDRSEGGLGIGLTLVKRLVEMQGGTVSAHSEGPDRGSEFTVRMPAPSLRFRRTCPAPASHRAPARGRSCARLDESRILVVDDNRDAAESMAVLLRMEGHLVDIAYDGPAALEAVRSMRPDVVLLDLGLPGIDGFELAERLRAMPDGARTLLIAISGYGQDEHREKSRRAGFDRHFVKPIDPASVTELLVAERRSSTRPTTGNVVAFCNSR